MVQIPTRARTLSFSVREAGHAQPYGRPRPLDPLARGEEPADWLPDAKRARQSYAPIRVPRTATPLAPKSVNLTVTAVPFPTDDAATEDAEHEDPTWGTSKMPIPVSSAPRQKRLVARTSAPTPPPASVRVAPPPPAPVTPSLPEASSLSRTPSTPHLATRARRPSPLAPYWKPPTLENMMSSIVRTRRGRVPPEPLARRALKTHFSRTAHGAAVVKMGARRAIAQAECIAAVERVKQTIGGSEIVNARRGAVGSIAVTRAVLAPPMVMVSPPSPTKGSAVALPLSRRISEEAWVPLSVQPMEVEPDECDIAEMETDEWCRL
ncbi:hypothetical protein BDV93DRAFT_548179 [Ceratobasidium sp. AG-I]|nr:hypothetical protein BDV93DRAFT_548179 [Ceratobasidium sp. AG-I]